MKLLAGFLTCCVMLVIAHSSARAQSALAANPEAALLKDVLIGIATLPSIGDPEQNWHETGFAVYGSRKIVRVFGILMEKGTFEPTGSFEEATLTEEEFNEVAADVSAADLINYQPPTDVVCPSILMYRYTIGYGRYDGSSNAFINYNDCPLSDEVLNLVALVRELAREKFDTGPVFMIPN